MLCLLLAFLSYASAQSYPDPQNATAFSLLYGYPLLAWQSAFVPVIDAVGTNEWQHSRQLSGPADRDVVKPNVDTLYSRLIYDLSQSNIEITIPDVPDENFKLFSFYDPFGDNFADVGTGGFYNPGTNGTSSDHVATVSSPTLYGTLLVRWGVNSTNADTVHGWQNKCKSKLLAPPKDITNANAPQLKALVDVYRANNSPAKNVLNLLAKYAPSNSPYEELEAAGITNGNYTPVSSVDLAAANATAVEMTTVAATDSQNINVENQGWSVLSPKYIGIYGTNYALRTLIALTGYLALRNPYAVYPTWSNSTSGNANALLNLKSNEAILFTFSGEPPLQEAGFWSLTACGSDYFLIPNKQGVYALGDRSSITYSDGTRVYSTSLTTGSNDRPFQLLLQPADVAPPANWTSNWLPAPAGGGDVIAQLRFFVAKSSLIDGSYEFPLVEKVAAITRKGSASGGNNGATGGALSTYNAIENMSWIALLAASVCVIGGSIAL